MIQKIKCNRIGYRARRLSFLFCGFHRHNQQPQFIVVSRRLPSRDHNWREFRNITIIQQQGKRCRWSKSLVHSDHLFIFLHKHNHLLLNTWYACYRAQLFSNVSRKAFNSLQQTATTTMSFNFGLAQWQASLRCASLKNKITKKTKCSLHSNNNILWMKSTRWTIRESRQKWL